MPAIRPPYAVPPNADRWAHELVRALSARDREIQNAIVPQTVFLATSILNTAYSSSSPATVVFGTELQDTGNRYDNATGIYYAPVRGLYHFTARMSFTSASDVNRAWKISVVTPTREYSYLFETLAVADAFSVEFTNPCVFLDQEETAKVQIVRISGSGTVTLNDDAEHNQFAGHLVEFA